MIFTWCQRVERNLWKDDQAFDRVIDGIESGDPAWLEVAIPLRPFSDAGPFIEPAPGIAEAYEKKTLAALAGVRDSDLADLAKECVRRVRLPRHRVPVER